jgi:hypothetical protein
MHENIAQALRAANLSVEVVEQTLNVTRGRGPMAQRVNLDPSDFIDWSSERPEETRRRDVSGYVRGVHTVLLEPKRSDAEQWTFVESAGSVLPTVEVESFRFGVRDATGGDAPWAQPLAGDLVIAWAMRLDNGMRVVTEPQFDRWGVTEDRVKAAGRSLLFHSTRSTAWKAGDWKPPVRALRVGDGFDAARMFVVEDVFFSDVDRNWRFAIPDPDLLLAISGDDAIDILVEETRRCFERADEPLSDRIWRIEKGTPIPVEE